MTLIIKHNTLLISNLLRTKYICLHHSCQALSKIQFIKHSKNQASISYPNCLLFRDTGQMSVDFMKHTVDFMRQVSDTKATP